LLTTRRYLRSDARLAKSLLTCGVLEEEEAGRLLQLSNALAVNAAANGKVREFARCVGVLQKQVDLEIKHHKAVFPRGHYHMIEALQPVQESTDIDGQAVPAAFYEPTSPEELGESLRFLSDFGLMDGEETNGEAS